MPWAALAELVKICVRTVLPGGLMAGLFLLSDSFSETEPVPVYFDSGTKLRGSERLARTIFISTALSRMFCVPWLMS